LREAAAEGRDACGHGLKNTPETLGRCIPNLLRQHLERWSTGENGREPAKALAHADAGKHLNALGQESSDSVGWRQAICALCRLGGRAVSVPEGRYSPALERIERARGESIGAQKLVRSASEISRVVKTHERAH